MNRAWLVLILILAAACSSGAPVETADMGRRKPASAPSGAGTFTLFVSNQSFDRPTVDIRVTIDGKQRVFQDFEVKNQHNWVAFTLDLATGKHELRAISARGETSLVKSFSTTGKRRWAVLDYWCCDPAFDEPRLAFDVLDRQPGFG